MNPFHLLIDILFNLYLMVVILRLWLQLAQADFYNPFSQFIVKATHPIVAPMRRVIPSFGSLDTATLVLALAVAGLKILVISMLFGNASVNPLSLLILSVILVISEALSLAFWILIIQAILSWVSQGYHPIEQVMRQLTDPILAPIRKIIPPVGGLDLSVLVAIIALQFLQQAMRYYIGYV